MTSGAMTNKEMLDLIHPSNNTPFAQARRVFSTYTALIEQHPSSQELSFVEIKKLEFEAVEKILALYGLDREGNPL